MASKYDYDEDLRQAVPFFNIFDLTNPVETRSKLLAQSKERPAPDRFGVKVDDFKIKSENGQHEIPIRVYRKEGTSDIHPVILNIHGGGFVIGRIEVDEPTCLEIVRKLPITVISVGYRLSPEYPYPAALFDCYDALKWIESSFEKLKVDPKKIVVQGMSAGGGLAAALCLYVRDTGGPSIYFQYLELPELDDRLNSESMKRFVDTPGWNTPNAKISWNYYLGDMDRNNVPIYASPARAENLSGLPPAYVSAFEYDPMRSEAVAYAEKLFSAGVSVELHVFSGAYHLAYLNRQSNIFQRTIEERIQVLSKILFKNK